MIEQLEAFAREHPAARLVENLGSQGYLSVMRHAAAMVGNSSSGIIEAASFELPGREHRDAPGGRLRPRNVVDVGYGRDEIAAGLAEALSPGFRDGLRGLENPYGDGHAAERIVETLRSVEPAG